MLSISEALAVRVLTQLARDPQMIGKLLEKMGAMPNVPTSTMGGHVFWTEIAFVSGWRLQKNSIFGNCRILDPNNIRRAWCGESAILQAFESLAKSFDEGL
jgi:hypothetical protein